MMNDVLKENYKLALQKLVGKECWGIVTSAGSHISFDFGEKIPRDNPLNNEFLSDDVRNFESELSLFIQCVWRIDSLNEVLFGAWTENELVKKGVNDIIGQKATSVQLFEPAFDLIVTFSNDLKLKIFCDMTNEEDSDDNYDFFTPEIIYTVGHKSILVTSEHDKK
jgi:hypothetical protein